MTLKIKRRIKRKPLSKAKANYKFHPGYSDNAKEQALKKYRKSKGKDFELIGSTVLRALEHIDLDAQMLPVVNQLTAKTENHPVMRLNYAAALLNVSYQTIWRWTTETQQLPMPVLIDNTKGREYPVYHLEEIRIIVGTIGKHLCSFKYYRKDNDAVKNKLFTGIEALRAKNFKVSGDENNGSSEKRESPRRKRKVRKS